MTCEHRDALDLLGVPHVIDVRLLKVTAFGKNAAAASPPFSLTNRKSYHITKWVARALWSVDGQVTGLPLTNENSRAFWRINMNGRLVRDPCAEISQGFSESGLALMVRSFSGRLGPLANLCPVLRLPFPVQFGELHPNNQARQTALLW